MRIQRCALELKRRRFDRPPRRQPRQTCLIRLDFGELALVRSFPCSSSSASLTGTLSRVPLLSASTKRIGGISRSTDSPSPCAFKASRAARPFFLVSNWCLPSWTIVAMCRSISEAGVLKETFWPSWESRTVGKLPKGQPDTKGNKRDLM